ncbi:hypothetical protein ABWJ92_09470 [Streptomyces sp. NPDC000609]|uniref:hypothetical protein n=1 Tax=Streptomyces sp. NPDC000609 TaxID=3160957 RepID=UPI00339528B4
MLITPDTPWWALLLPLLARGAGGGVAGAPVMAVAVRGTAPERVGMAAGTVATLASLCAGVGTAALGAVFARHGGHDSQDVTDGARAVLGVSAALAVVAVLTTVALIDPRRVPRPDRARVMRRCPELCGFAVPPLVVAETAWPEWSVTGNACLPFT